MPEKLTLAGWVFMSASWLIIVLLNIWCFVNIFKEKDEEIVEPLKN